VGGYAFLKGRSAIPAAVYIMIFIFGRKMSGPVVPGWLVDCPLMATSGLRSSSDSAVNGRIL